MLDIALNNSDVSAKLSNLALAANVCDDAVKTTHKVKKVSIKQVQGKLTTVSIGEEQNADNNKEHDKKHAEDIGAGGVNTEAIDDGNTSAGTADVGHGADDKGDQELTITFYRRFDNGQLGLIDVTATMEQDGDGAAAIGAFLGCRFSRTQLMSFTEVAKALSPDGTGFSPGVLDGFSIEQFTGFKDKIRGIWNKEVSFSFGGER